MANERVPIKFSHKWGRYNADDVAGFGPDKSAELIARKIAKPYYARMSEAIVKKAASALGVGQDAPKPTEPQPTSTRRRRGRPRKGSAA